MTNLPADATLEDLEKIKLRREIAEHDKVIYRKPAFYAVVGPTLLAALTLAIGFRTGLIDLQQENVRAETTFLENKAILLKIDERGLLLKKQKAEASLEEARAELKAEEARIAADLAEARRKLEEERAEMQARLEQERAALDQELTRVRDEQAQAITSMREKFEAERDGLKAELSGLKDNIEERTAELAMLRVELENAHALSLVRQLREDSHPNPQTKAVDALIVLVGEEGPARDIVLKEADAEASLRHKAVFLYVLYQASKSEEDFARLTEFARQNPSSEDVWNIVGIGYWPAAGERRILELLFEVAETGMMEDAAFADASAFFLSLESDFETLNKLLVQDRARAARNQAARVIVDKETSYPTVDWIALMLGYVDPDLYLIFVAKILGDGDLDPTARSYISTQVQELRSGGYEKHAFITEAMAARGWPEDVSRFDFAEWAGRPEIETLIDTLEARFFAPDAPANQ